VPRRSAILAGAVGALALGATPALANDAGTITHTTGAVSATVSWSAAEFGIADPKLVVVRGGAPFDVPVTDICAEGCIIAPDDARTAPLDSSLKVADLDLDGGPEVLLDTFSGGAHCCVTTRVLTFDGAGYRPTDIEWRDVGYTLTDLDRDGRLELNGYDPAFSAAFTAFAASAFPPLILHVDHGRTVDVTRSFPAVVRKDAQRQRRLLRRLKRSDDVRGVLAAYVADEYLLGRGKVGLAEIDHQRRRKAYLVTAGYRKTLLRRLKAWGYRARTSAR
jgi:hypothetical protein